MLNGINKILILKWGALGDIIASTPAINLIINRFPNAQIDIVSNRLFQEIFPSGGAFYTDFFDIRGNKLELIKKIRSKKYDLIVNLKWTSEGAAWIAFFSGAKFRAGSGPKNLQFAYNLKSPYLHGRCHEIIRNSSIVEGMGINSEKIEFITYIDENSEKKIENFFNEKNIKDIFILGLHPGASKESKSWITDRFIRVLLDIVEVFPIKIVVLYGKNDKPKSEEIVRKCSHPNIILGPITENIRELSAAIKKCNLFFCNNSGPMNLSVALGKPTIAILGSTHPSDWGPYKNVSIKSPLYLKSYSEDDEICAMKAIRSDKVTKILKDKIKELI